MDMITLDNLKQLVTTMQQLASDLGWINWVHYEANRHNFVPVGDDLCIQLVPVWYPTGFNDENILQYTNDEGTTKAPMKCVLTDSKEGLTHYNPSTELDTFYYLMQKRQ